MSDFMLRFLISNLLIAVIIGILLLVRRLFSSSLSARMQYHLWFLLLGLLAVPFIPIHTPGPFRLFSWVNSLNSSAAEGTTAGTAGPGASAIRLKDFAIDSGRSALIGTLLLVIWITGILVMMRFMVKSYLRLQAVKRSALPLQDPEIRRLYHNCLRESGITKELPIYSTAFLKSPALAGLIQPCIYLPLSLISDYRPSDLRYMLLHELQHYRHRDILTGFLLNLAETVYWLNPMVWYALSEMRCDREAACDASVLELLDEASYLEYGEALIRFAEKLSRRSTLFTAGLSGSMRQMKRRILTIASYRKSSPLMKVKGTAVLSLTALLLSGFVPALPAYTKDTSRYLWDAADGQAVSLELSSYFAGYEGCFVLYDLEEDRWNVYDMERALTRIAPDSTYKPYAALFALEAGIISPEDSFRPWDGTVWPFSEWNQDQTLSSAMTSSVNWYFQGLDRQLGRTALQSCITGIGYGNEQINGDLSSYWLESSLKISPVEQVQLLARLHQGRLGFKQENILAVKDSLLLSESESGKLYGKTGTGQINGQAVNGWFIGFIEADGRTQFFAANIAGASDASGSAAAEITLSILSDLGIWHS